MAPFFSRFMSRLAFLFTVVAWSLGTAWGDGESKADRPNILWITCEDISPNLGCYGDSYAVTPHLDALAAQGVRYVSAFAPIGVCAPSRSCLITGMYPPSIGTQHMRCRGQLPAGVGCFSQYLREAGYYCTNNSKTDYNFVHSRETWNESSHRAHWRKRQAGQPFFSVFNFTSCHESQIRLPERAYRERTADFSDEERHDPARAAVPPYHPDTPEVRRDWARYADMITFMDKEAGRVLAELEADGLAENTIVFFFSDHGAGMPRSKRWLYDSSVRVPLIVRFPEKYARWAPAAAGATCDRLVSFVDFAPTVLSLAGVPLPNHFQGQAFLGERAGKPRQYVYGYRDRMDERTDMLRSVRNERYKYIRNYHPELPYFGHQHIGYMYQMPTMQVWQRLADEGKLSGAPAAFMAERKPADELYDTLNDPHEVRNLAADPEFRPVLVRMSGALDAWMKEILDLGNLPEADLRTRFGDEPPYDAARSGAHPIPWERIRETAEWCRHASEDPGHLDHLKSRLDDPDPAVRFWAATGLGQIGSPSPAVKAALETALKDDAATVRLAAADGLCRLSQSALALPVLRDGLSDSQEWTRLQAIQIVDRHRLSDSSLAHLVEARCQDDNEYVVRVAKHITGKPDE